MILAIGSVADDTFCAGLNALTRAGVRFAALDIGVLTIAGSIEMTLDVEGDGTIRYPSTRFEIGAITGMLLRPIELARFAPDARLATRYRRTQAAIDALAVALSRRRPVLNPPAADATGFSKLLHLHRCAPYPGWSAPRSCLTNDPADARAFIAECGGRAIYKGASATKTWVRAVELPADLDRLDQLHGAPVLFQELIEGDDVRVHVVGDRTIAERIGSDDIDYRTAPAPRLRFGAIELPADISESCVRLTRDMGIGLSGIDFKIDRRSGEWFVLEANTMPCYQGYDRRSGGAISAAIVDYLRSGPTGRRDRSAMVRDLEMEVAMSGA